MIETWARFLRVEIQFKLSGRALRRRVGILMGNAAAEDGDSWKCIEFGHQIQVAPINIDGQVTKRFLSTERYSLSHAHMCSAGNQS